MRKRRLEFAFFAERKKDAYGSLKAFSVHRPEAAIEAGAKTRLSRTNGRGLDSRQ